MATKKKLLQAAAGNAGDAVGAWDLSYAYYDPPAGLTWDLSNANFSDTEFSVNSQETSVEGLFFKPDGTKMYVCGSIGDDVNEYDLSTAWMVSTASYSQNFSVSTQDGTPVGLFFKPDGTKMYMIGTATDSVFEYDLSTAWDISSASYSQNFTGTATLESNVQGVFFKDDGTKMYVVGRGGDSVYEYDLSTAWDVSTASHLQTKSVSAQGASPRGLSFKPDGTKMMVLDGQNNEVDEYDLSTAWDISSASYSQNFSVSGQDSGTRDIFFRPDGFGFYVVGASTDTVFQYSLGRFDTTAQEASPLGVFFKSDGTKMYIVGTGSDEVNEYDLSTAWDLSTASFLQNFSVQVQELNPNGIFFKSDGTKMYIVGATDDAVDEYDLSTAWDISTSSYLQYFSVAAQETSPQGVFFRYDGTKMYIVGSSGDAVFEYDLSTAWDISSASFSQNFSVTSQEIVPTGLFFKDNGTKMYIVGTNGDDVNEYDLSTAWDISSASFSQKFSVSVQDTSPEGVFFKPDGTKMYVVGRLFDGIFAYTLGPQS